MPSGSTEGSKNSGGWLGSDRSHVLGHGAACRPVQGFTVSQVHNGQMIINAFITATREQGSVLQVITYTHSGGNGLYLDNNGGFYAAE